MKQKKFYNLKTGDLVRHKSGGDVYVVTANYGSRITAVRTIDMTNPCEWKKFKVPRLIPEE